MSAVDLMSFDHEVVWRPWAVSYFLLVGTAAGAALLMTYARLMQKTEARGAMVVAASFALASGLPLLADLHQPARFLHFYISASPDSIMWWGSWFLPSFIATTFLLALLRGLRSTSPLCRVERALTGLVGLLALCILGYTAGEMSVVTARPLWNAWGFPLLLISTALMSGAGATLAYNGLRGEEGPGRYLLLVSGAASLVIFGLWMLNDPNLVHLAAEQMPLTLFVSFVCLGVVLPVALSIALPQMAGQQVVTGALAVYGALAFRWATFNGAQLMSKTETALYGKATIASPEALHTLVGSLGMLVLCLLFISVLLRVLAGQITAPTQA